MPEPNRGGAERPFASPGALGPRRPAALGTDPAQEPLGRPVGVLLYRMEETGSGQGLHPFLLTLLNHALSDQARTVSTVGKRVCVCLSVFRDQGQITL